MPAHTKNHYHVLGLESPTWRSSTPISDFQIRAAYRRALFNAHPDKRHRPHNANDNTQFAKAGIAQRGRYTVDDVVEAFRVLGDKSRKEEFDAWLAARYEEGVVRYGDGERGWAEAFSAGRDGDGAAEGGKGHDFVLGLEQLDLSDFEVVEGDVGVVSLVSTPDSVGSAGLGDGREGSVRDGGSEWVRGCRCGAGKGFRILEYELERASRRGEKEVLVGCEGCSLWVRVGFDVEEEDG